MLSPTTTTSLLTTLLLQSLFLSPTLSHPLSSLSSLLSLSSRQTKSLPGSCPTTHYPTESQYTLGYTTFCTSHTPARLTETTPLIYTLILQDFYNNPIPWIYTISLDNGARGGNIGIPYNVTQQMCLEIFKRVVEGDEVGEAAQGRTGGGVLGENYCVVDGTGGDRADGRLGMSGEGEVLVMGGMIKTFAQKEGWGIGTENFGFETREKKGG